MAFSSDAWRRNQALYDKIVAMPFNHELMTGTLPEATFKYYMIQDAHYLEGFARALSAAAAKSETSDHIVQFAASAGNVITVERQLHREYFERFGVSEQQFRDTEPSPECELYVSYLLKLAFQSSFAVLLAGILPCFWIYAEVGKHVHEGADRNNPYRAWIDTYASAEFDEGVRRVITTVDEVARGEADNSIERMHQAFKRATQLEWIFWDGAYHERGWPV